MAINALIIGLGNDYRSDDAIGRVVAQKLSAESLDDVRILEESGEGVAFDEHLASCRLCDPY